MNDVLLSDFRCRRTVLAAYVCKDTRRSRWCLAGGAKGAVARASTLPRPPGLCLLRVSALQFLSLQTQYGGDFAMAITTNFFPA